ncbi:regulatory GntR family protein [Tamaricihabitans halophyticus]|uniref:Regulatory GntR family protein n=1 Tax=Tamaricihabitans halophyticus TaxID=1262583 RepID=A0A4R2QAC8_9PSEU|nr:GntR family transcriptional regulator [Tamaricihabitans halophyticus]TCP45038.1 regulatory GntR family protein [Tamaricihabitans halophyticus]
MGKLNPNSSEPPYLQVADDVIRSIRAGEYKPGGQLPSYSQLAKNYGVAVGTVRSALDLLRERSVIVTRQGTGTSVHPGLDPASLPRSVGRSGQTGEMTEVLRLLNEIRDRLGVLEERFPPRT